MREASQTLAAVAEQLAKLRDAYLARLPAELAELEVLASGMTGSEADRQLLDEIHHRLHKLAGSGGTFGLKRLGEHASRLERTAKAWLAGSLEGQDAAALSRFQIDVAALPGLLAEASGTAVLPVSATTTNTGQHVHIWLVEDDDALGPELARLLGQFGYEVSLFTRMADAETAAMTARPDIMIMDVMFPDEGVNATEVLASQPALRALGCPLLFISACGDFMSRVRAARLGAEGFLLKPIDVPRLVDRLEQMFEDSQASTYRVLIVDDDVSLSEHFRLVLTLAGMEVEVLNAPEKIIDRVSAFQPELVLLDMNMPGYSGPELATVIRQYDEWIGLPIVYLSAETDLDKQIQALGRGADDFITKPISDAQLVSAVRVRVARFRQLANLISNDSLTGLLKHSRIKEEVDLALARSRRSGSPVSVAMVDIDHFKSVNDTYGHAVGDQVNKAIAHLLRQRLRKSDGIGRYGGEEFVALLPECDSATAWDILDNIRERFEALRFHHEGLEFSCTFSAGIACSSLFPESSGSELLVAADHALYEAKHGGRNQVRLANAATLVGETG